MTDPSSQITVTLVVPAWRGLVARAVLKVAAFLMDWGIIPCTEQSCDRLGRWIGRFIAAGLKVKA